MKAKVSIIEVLLFTKNQSLLKLSDQTGIDWRRLKAIVNGAPVKKREMSRLSAAIGIDLQKLNQREPKP